MGVLVLKVGRLFLPLPHHGLGRGSPGSGSPVAGCRAQGVRPPHPGAPSAAPAGARWGGRRAWCPGGLPALAWAWGALTSFRPAPLRPCAPPPGARAYPERPAWEAVGTSTPRPRLLGQRGAGGATAAGWPCARGPLPWVLLGTEVTRKGKAARALSRDPAVWPEPGRLQSAGLWLNGPRVSVRPALRGLV